MAFSGPACRKRPCLRRACHTGARRGYLGDQRERRQIRQMPALWAQSGICRPRRFRSAPRRVGQFALAGPSWLGGRRGARSSLTVDGSVDHAAVLKQQVTVRFRERARRALLVTRYLKLVSCSARDRATCNAACLSRIPISAPCRIRGAIANWVEELWA